MPASPLLVGLVGSAYDEQQVEDEVVHVAVDEVHGEEDGEAAKVRHDPEEEQDERRAELERQPLDRLVHRTVRSAQRETRPEHGARGGAEHGGGVQDDREVVDQLVRALRNRREPAERRLALVGESDERKPAENGGALGDVAAVVAVQDELALPDAQ